MLHFCNFPHNIYIFFNSGTSSLSDSILGLNEITENKSLWKMLAAEFIGTLILVTVGCGSCLGNPTIVQIALTFGLTVAAIVQVSLHQPFPV